jgi:GT2 family glycosyltransferase
MKASSINTVRLYTVPPAWLLDTAQQHGLYVIVGIPWEQHITFLDNPGRMKRIVQRIDEGVQACAGHPSLLCIAIGNEISSSLVRWYGRHRVERFLKRLYKAAKQADPHVLVTYVNYPSTAYLHLPFIDLVCFNVYLEQPQPFAAYLSHLQTLAGERPLLITEIGLDSQRNGLEAQGTVLDWQIRTTFATGCAGAVVFAWTDEWYRGGHNILDWSFGLTTHDRTPKPALAAVRSAFTITPCPPHRKWPRISVVICSYNGARTIRDCLEKAIYLDYPHFEVIVVDDGSTDATAAIASGYPSVRLIRTPNRGLSNARNTGMHAATGEIVAYLDDDAYPDPHWLHYLALTFLHTSHAAAGGPNIAAPAGGIVAECVANAPGNPTHILLSDTEAEHLPGCNIAVRKACLQEIGGFDPRYQVAGDDVDVCWRLRQHGWTLGFHAAAVVWHYRRHTLRAYCKQQYGYGRAEALLEQKWPEKFNPAGYFTWAGRIYGRGLIEAPRWHRERIHHGTWGSGLFQSVYQPAPDMLWSLPLMPDWYVVLAALTVLSLSGIVWPPFLLALPLLVGAASLSVGQALFNAHQSASAYAARPWHGRLARYLLTALLYLLQPLARLAGRINLGLTPWRQRRTPRLALPLPRHTATWSEAWHPPIAWLESLEQVLCSEGAYVLRGGEFDRWDLEVRSGLLGAARTRMVIFADAILMYQSRAIRAIAIRCRCMGGSWDAVARLSRSNWFRAGGCGCIYRSIPPARILAQRSPMFPMPNRAGSDVY